MSRSSTFLICWVILKPSEIRVCHEPLDPSQVRLYLLNCLEVIHKLPGRVAGLAKAVSYKRNSQNSPRMFRLFFLASAGPKSYINKRQEFFCEVIEARYVFITKEKSTIVLNCTAEELKVFYI